MAAWCENNGHVNTRQLGKETEYGIFEAEYVGFILALQLMKDSFQVTTRQVTIVLDNQGVVKDLAHKKTSSKALTHKIAAIDYIREVWMTAPHVQIFVVKMTIKGRLGYCADLAQSMSILQLFSLC